jgi:hypothetical protein
MDYPQGKGGELVGRHIVRFALAALVCALVGAVPLSVPASTTPAFPVLLGHVGPNTQIGLLDPDGVELDGRTLPAGTYTVEVDDSEVGHNFHLLGDAIVSCDPPGCTTTLEETGHFTWTVTFQPGPATYQCDPHSGFMIGNFMVTDPPPPPPPPPPPEEQLPPRWPTRMFSVSPEVRVMVPMA